jgi:hypothetical protein
MKKLLFLLFLTIQTVCVAQQPQAPAGTPLFSTNAKWTNGVAPGYWPTAGSGLTLNISGGTAFCTSIVTYAGGTLTLTNSTTNYVYLDTTSSCAPASNTSGFTSTTIPLATVVTSGGAITTITDVRTMFFQASTSGGSVSLICSGTVTVNPGAIASSACATITPATCTGAASTDNVMLDFSGDTDSTTGYLPGAMLTIKKYASSNVVNVHVCNNTGSSITPTSITLNYRVVR